MLALAAVMRARRRRFSGPRVVCVSKQINEFMYDIHAESVLVARDLTSIYPAAITRLPSVGYHRALSAEGIISMRPTMLLTDGNLGPDAVVDAGEEGGDSRARARARLERRQRAAAHAAARKGISSRGAGGPVVAAWKARDDRCAARQRAAGRRSIRRACS